MRLATVKRQIFSILLLLCLPVQAIALPEGITAEQAYKQGTLLYQQNKYTQARPYLDLATDNGYPAAALMMADIYWTNPFIQTKKEAEYSLKAAELDSVIGMLRVGGSRSIDDERSIWQALVMKELTQLAEQGNFFALRMMAIYTEDEEEKTEWLEKAADAGDYNSQHRLAKRYQNGKGVFLWPGSRDKEVVRLLKLAADSGYRLAKADYAFHLKDTGDESKYKAIMDELVEQGDAHAILGLCIINMNEGKYESSAFHCKIYKDSMGSEGKLNGLKNANNVFKESTSKLSNKQVSNINSRADEYLKTHTVHYQKNIKEYEYTLESIKQLN